jgi:hypothetical protein
MRATTCGYGKNVKGQGTLWWVEGGKWALITIKVLAVAQGDASGQKGILVKYGGFSKFAFY